MWQPNRHGNGFALHLAEAKGIAAECSCEVVLPLIGPKLISPATEGASVSWWPSVWKGGLSSPYPQQC